MTATWKDRPFIFFVGPGRCGTTSINRVLEQIVGVCSVHEETYRPAGGWAMGLMVYHNYLYHNPFTSPDPISKCIELYLESRCSVLPPGMPFIDTNGGQFFVHVLNDLLPKAKYVHIVRDPRDWVKSGLNRGWYMGQGAWEATRILPRGPMELEWPRMSRSQRIAWSWMAGQRYVLRFLADIPEDCKFTVKFENLFLTQDMAPSQALLTFLGIGRYKVEGWPHENPRMDQSRLYPPEDRIGYEDYLEKYAADLLERYGYGRTANDNPGIYCGIQHSLVD